MYKDRKAVSPVVGVILMVAATIVIAAIVMGYLGTFTPPKKTLDIMATNVQIYENNGYWYLTATLTGADVSQVTRDDLRISMIDLNTNEQNSTANQNVPNDAINLQGDIISLNISYAFTNIAGNMGDGHKIHVTITYIPTGQPLFDGIVIARE